MSRILGRSTKVMVTRRASDRHDNAAQTHEARPTAIPARRGGGFMLQPTAGLGRYPRHYLAAFHCSKPRRAPRVPSCLADPRALAASLTILGAQSFLRAYRDYARRRRTVKLRSRDRAYSVVKCLWMRFTTEINAIVICFGFVY
ncbi:jg3447 [Pararge aegeria aegeria]|uniref:Jg3447 protein n=1 Tax=Pararge aegeria aegeria TaxID=348720 RepID=A0A8S4RA48_9NEOP|nr:jg3447 [Pararge aegeria aegeria]